MPTDYEATSLRDLLCGSVSTSLIGQSVTVCGWVAKRREHGEHLAFLDVRDQSGIVQVVVDGTVDHLIFEGGPAFAYDDLLDAAV